MSRAVRKSRWFVLALMLLACLWAGHGSPPAAARDDAPAKKVKRGRKADTTLRDKIDEKFDFKGNDDPKLSLKEVLDFLEEKRGVELMIDEKAFKDDNLNDVSATPVTDKAPLPPMHGTTLRAVLTKVLGRLPPRSAARFVIRARSIEITTETAIRRELDLPIPEMKADAVNALPLTPLVWESFSDEPLEDVLHKLAEVEGVTILIDGRVREKASAKIDATLRNVPRDTAVVLLADMAGLAVVKRHNAYYVTSAENAARLSGAKK